MPSETAQDLVAPARFEKLAPLDGNLMLQFGAPGGECLCHLPAISPEAAHGSHLRRIDSRTVFSTATEVAFRLQTVARKVGFQLINCVGPGEELLELGMLGLHLPLPVLAYLL
jgi:hypothetical protein